MLKQYNGGRITGLRDGDILFVVSYLITRYHKRVLVPEELECGVGFFCELFICDAILIISLINVGY